MATPSQREARLQTLGGLLRATAETYPDRHFVQCNSPWLTFAEVDTLSDQLAAGLRREGVGRGDRVALMMGNCVEFVMSLFACAKLGAVQVPINTTLRGEALLHPLAHSGATTVIADAGGQEQLAPLLPELSGLDRLVSVGAPLHDTPEGPGPPRLPYAALAEGPADQSPDIDPTELCVILYTSGTTGAAKGCMVSHAYQLNIPRGFYEAGWFDDGDTLFGANPLFHASGQIWLLMSALLAGGAAVIEPDFDAATYMARARETAATVLWGFGGMALALLAQPPDPGDRHHKVRQATWVPMAIDAQSEFEKRFGIPVNSEIYGPTECWPATITPASSARRPQSIGRVARNMEVRVVDDGDEAVPCGDAGQIIIRPQQPNMIFSGYWKNPEATVAAFQNLWFHTGDYGRFDPDGYLYFVDRRADLIESGDQVISSIELENAIRAHPSVAAVAVHVVACPDGNEIKAVIVPMAGVSLQPAELAAFFKTTFSEAQRPRYAELVDRLPTNASLKVLKHVLRAQGITPNTWDLRTVETEES